MTRSSRIEVLDVSFRSPSVASLVALLLVGTGVVTTAVAADKAAGKAPTGAITPGDRILTPAQLKACLEQKERMRERVDAIQKDRGAIEAEKAEIDRGDKALVDALTGVDRTKAEEVDAYNERVRLHRERVQAFQQRATDYNARAETAKGAQDEYARSCENRRYDDRDLADIQRNKK